MVSTAGISLEIVAAIIITLSSGAVLALSRFGICNATQQMPTGSLKVSPWGSSRRPPPVCLTPKTRDRPMALFPVT